MPRAVLNGNVLADSANVERVEGNAYFPRADVTAAVLEPSDTQYTCPWKGKAQYFDVRVGETLLADAAWSYPDPKPKARAIAGHVAFDTRKGIEVG